MTKMPAAGEVKRLRAAILDIDAHAAPIAEDEDGFVTTGYIVSVGAIHRALGVVGHSSRKCRLCSPDRNLCAEADLLASTTASYLRAALEAIAEACGTSLVADYGPKGNGVLLDDILIRLRFIRPLVAATPPGGEAQ